MKWLLVISIICVCSTGDTNTPESPPVTQTLAPSFAPSSTEANTVKPTETPTTPPPPSTTATLTPVSTTATPETVAPTTPPPTTVSPTPETATPTTPPTTVSPTPATVTTLPTTVTPETVAPTTPTPTTVSPTPAPVPTTVTPAPTSTTGSTGTATPETVAPTTSTPTTVSPTTVSPTPATVTTLPTTITPETVAPTTSTPTTVSPTPAPVPTTVTPPPTSTTGSTGTATPETVVPTTPTPTTVSPTPVSTSSSGSLTVFNHDRWCSIGALGPTKCVTPVAYYGMEMGIAFSLTGLFVTDPLAEGNGTFSCLDPKGGGINFLDLTRINIVLSNVWGIRGVLHPTFGGVYVCEAGSHRIQKLVNNSLTIVSGSIKNHGSVVNVLFSEAVWETPTDLTYSKSSEKLYITDRAVKLVNQVSFRTLYVTRLSKLDAEVMGIALYRRLVFVGSDEQALIFRINTITGSPQIFLDQPNVVKSPKSIVMDCARATLLVADSGSDRIAAIDFRKKDPDFLAFQQPLRAPSALYLREADRTLFIGGARGFMAMTTLPKATDAVPECVVGQPTLTVPQTQGPSHEGGNMPSVPPLDPRCAMFVQRDGVVGKTTFSCFAPNCPVQVTCDVAWNIEATETNVVSMLHLSPPPNTCNYPFFQILDNDGNSLLPTRNASLLCSPATGFASFRFGPWEPLIIKGPQQVIVRIFMEQSSAVAAVVGYTIIVAQTSRIPFQSNHQLVSQSLLQLYQSAGGPSWKNKQHWGHVEVNVCSWYGVTCTLSEEDDSNLIMNPSVIAIDLTANNLIGTLPKNFGLDLCAFPTLQELKLGFDHAPNIFSVKRSNSSQALTGTIPSTLFTACVGLRVLELQGHALEGCLPKLAYGSMAQLRSINVSMNLLNGTMPEWLGSATPALQYFDISFNKFEGPIPRSLSKGNDNVKVFRVNGNALNGTIPTDLFNDWLSLELLDASQNNLEGALPSFERGLMFFQTLKLTANRFYGTLPSAWGTSIRSVVTLDLIGNILSGTVPEFYKMYWKSLTTFRVSNNKFSGGINHIIGMQGIREIDAENNQFSGNISQSSATLKILNIARNSFRENIIGDSLHALYPNVKKTGTLYLSGNRWSCPLPAGIPEWKDFGATDCYRVEMNATVVSNGTTVDGIFTQPILVNLVVSLSYYPDPADESLWVVFVGEQVASIQYVGNITNFVNASCCGVQCGLKGIPKQQSVPLLFEVYYTTTGVLPGPRINVSYESNSPSILINSTDLAMQKIQIRAKYLPLLKLYGSNQPRIPNPGVVEYTIPNLMPWMFISVRCNFSFGAIILAERGNHTTTTTTTTTSGSYRNTIWTVVCPFPQGMNRATPTPPLTTLRIYGTHENRNDPNDLLLDTKEVPFSLAGPVRQVHVCQIDNETTTVTTTALVYCNSSIDVQSDVVVSAPPMQVIFLDEMGNVVEDSFADLFRLNKAKGSNSFATYLEKEGNYSLSSDTATVKGVLADGYYGSLKVLWNITLYSPLSGSHNITLKFFALEFAVNITIVVFPGRPIDLAAELYQIVHFSNSDVFSPQPKIFLLDQSGNRVGSSHIAPIPTIRAELHVKPLFYENFRHSEIGVFNVEAGLVNEFFEYNTLRGYLLYGYEYKLTFTVKSILPNKNITFNIDLQSCPGKIAVPGTLECSDCLSGLHCDGTSITRTLPRYWRATNLSRRTVFCINAEICPGNDECPSGSSGKMCLQCDPDYVMTESGCAPCASKVILVVQTIFVIVAGFLYGMVLVFTNLPSERGTGESSVYNILLKQLFNHLQVMALTRYVEIQMPSSLMSFFHAFENLSTIDRNMTQARCYAGNSAIHQYDLFVVASLFPVIVALLSFPMSWIAFRFLKLSSESDSIKEQALERKTRQQKEKQQQQKSSKNNRSERSIKVDHEIVLTDCTYCGLDFAAIECLSCNQRFCVSCSETIHKRMKAVKHHTNDLRYKGIAKNIITDYVSEMPSKRQMFLRTFMVLLFLVFPSAMTQIAGVLTCTEYTEESYFVENLTNPTPYARTELFLNAEVSVDCSTETHKSYMVSGMVLYLFYGCVIPLLIWVYLSFHRDELGRKYFLELYGFLYCGYRKPCYFWEALVLLRKSGFVLVIAGVRQPELKIQICLWILYLTFVTRMWMRPSQHYDWIDSCSLMTQIITFNFLPVLPPLYDPSYATYTTITTFIFTVNAVLVAIYMYYIALEFKRELMFYLCADPNASFEFQKIVLQTRRYISLVSNNDTSEHPEKRGLITFIREESGDAILIRRKFEKIAQGEVH